MRGLRTLGYIERCQRNPAMTRVVRDFDHAQQQAWWSRRHPPPPMNGPVLASWFDDSGSTACGIHASLGFATLMSIPCGATIRMRGPSGVVVTATREDSGPYVSGRTFDLNPGLKAALGCGDLCDVMWR